MASWPRVVGSAMVRAALLYAIWLLIDDNVSQPELFTGIGVALLAVVVGSVARRSSTVRARLNPQMLRYAYRPPLLLIADSFRVCVALINALITRRRVQGRFRAARYEATADTQADAARRVLTEWSASLAPNRYVIGIDESTDTLLVHELVPTHGSLDPLELG